MENPHHGLQMRKYFDAENVDTSRNYDNCPEYHRPMPSLVNVRVVIQHNQRLDLRSCEISDTCDVGLPGKDSDPSCDICYGIRSP